MSQWYYQLLGEEFGPVTAEALRELIQEGTISESDPVRPVDSADWRPASSCEELQGTDDDVISDLSELSFEFERVVPRPGVQHTERKFRRQQRSRKPYRK